MPKRRLALLIAGSLIWFGAPAFAQDRTSLMESMCFDDAGQMYNIAPSLLMAIAKTESDFRADAKNTNTNGTEDRCHMQINSFWKKHMQGDWEYLSDPCYCTKVGAWVLSQCINRYGYTWDAVACYNTGQSRRVKNPIKRRKATTYVDKVQKNLLVLKGGS